MAPYPWYCHAIRGHNSQDLSEFNCRDDPPETDGIQESSMNKQKKQLRETASWRSR
jgi:hypothetical protein